MKEQQINDEIIKEEVADEEIDHKEINNEKIDQEEINLQITEKILPCVALRGLTIFPGMIIHFDLNRKKSVRAMEQAMMENQEVFLITQKTSGCEDPSIEDLYSVGTVAKVKQVSKLPNKIIRVLVEGLYRAKLVELEEEKYYLSALTQDYPQMTLTIDELENIGMMRQCKELLEQFSSYFPKVGKTMYSYLNEHQSIELLIDQIAINLPVTYHEKQKILETIDVKIRYELLATLLLREIEIGKVRVDLTEKIKNRIDKNQKEYLLREQLKFIKEELGESDPFSDGDQFEEQLKKIKASKEVKEKIKKEINRFKSLSGSSSESAVERGYIETLLEMPWDKISKDNLDIVSAEKILNQDHYGLEQVKERILEYLAVRILNKQGNSPILCLVGPPGTGKTSIAKSIAKALDKKYVRLCLGGVRDEAEIRGHRKTYVGAMPGRIATGMKQASVKNPLILLDEIDKVGNDQRGDTASALLEVLDSEQNNKFRDHYIEIPIDLSEVFFIATANSIASIPRPLLDRMEVIEVNSYTMNEKFHILKEFLLHKQFEKHGLTNEQLLINDNACKAMIQCYTREAGVRDLERKVGKICRKVAREILQTKKQVVKVSSKNLEKYLGKEKYAKDKINHENEIGIVRGLAWTSVGGDTLQIEVNCMPGKGDIELTGQLGDVMKESALAGISYIRSVSNQFKIPADTFKKNDFHIHIPEGAVPKDGPSAGITMATALLSAITKKQVKANVAMTGEITLRGRVLPIGGLKEKILAAKIAGITTVLIPKENQKDMDEISAEITNGIEIVFVETMEEVVKYAFVEEKENESGNKKC